jgi:hypothetical protein
MKKDTKTAKPVKSKMTTDQQEKRTTAAIEEAKERIADFMAKAFIVDIGAKYVGIAKPIEPQTGPGALYEISDTMRGKFYVAIYAPKIS